VEERVYIYNPTLEDGMSKLLGHADVSITYNIYIHLYGDDLEEMRGVLG
jgi:hypothetical protein